MDSGYQSVPHVARQHYEVPYVEKLPGRSFKEFLQKVDTPDTSPSMMMMMMMMCRLTAKRETRAARGRELRG
jgi:hypothetical protein